MCVRGRTEALGEPGAPEKGTGSALWTAAIGLARYLEHRASMPPVNADEAAVPEHPTAATLSGTTTQPPPLAPSSSSSSPSTATTISANASTVAENSGAAAEALDPSGMKVLELGCGTGLVSLLLAHLGAIVTATDIPDCLVTHTRPNVARNVKRFKESGMALRGEVLVEELVWGLTPLEGVGRDWDLIVASDVIYRAEHVPLLLETLTGVTGPRTTVGTASPTPEVS